jgi:hypothetical protein
MTPGGASPVSICATNVSGANEIRGAKRGANGGRHQATRSPAARARTRDPDRHRHLVLMHVDPRAPLIQHLHPGYPFLVVRQDDQARCPRSPAKNKDTDTRAHSGNRVAPGQYEGFRVNLSNGLNRAKENRRRRAAHTPSLIHRGQSIRAMEI